MLEGSRTQITLETSAQEILSILSSRSFILANRLAVE